MKAFTIVLALFLVAMPITAAPVELPLPNLVDQLFGWFVGVWEAMGPMIEPTGAPQTQEMGPMIDPSGQPNGEG